MSAPDSVANWLVQLKAGNAAAAQKLWERYFSRMVALARKRLPRARRREADEEDVALSAFDSFCRGAAQERFPQLADRDDLWQLLVVITARKAIDLVVRQNRKRVGGGKVSGESALLNPAEGEEGGIEAAVGSEPTPDLVLQMNEAYQRLLSKLGDDELRSIAVWKLEGHTNEEIAGRLDSARATVERRLRVIRRLWEGELPRRDR
jgi:DNA-directed RNA polymerase specialized sigma24 family protein